MVTENLHTRFSVRVIGWFETEFFDAEFAEKFVEYGYYIMQNVLTFSDDNGEL